MLSAPICVIIVFHVLDQLFLMGVDAYIHEFELPDLVGEGSEHAVENFDQQTLLPEGIRRTSRYSQRRFRRNISGVLRSPKGDGKVCCYFNL